MPGCKYCVCCSVFSWVALVAWSWTETTVSSSERVGAKAHNERETREKEAER